MVELAEKRQENSKTFKLDDGRLQQRISTGIVHYKNNYTDKSEQWKDIDLTWEGNRITKAPYELTHEGNRLTLRDKRTGNITTIELDSIAGTKVATANWGYSKGLAKVSDIALDTDLEVIAEFSAVRFRRVLKSDKALQEAKFKVTGDTSLVKVRASDRDGVIPVETSLKDGILTETLKPDRPIKYPVRIDPTYQVGTGTDDVYVQDPGGWNQFNMTLQVTAGAQDATYDRYGSGMRFTGIAIEQAATVENAKLIITAQTSNAGVICNTRISAEDVDDAVTFADDIDVFMARYGNKTSAVVDWDGIGAWAKDSPYDSVEIKAVIQEIVDRGGWNSGQDIVIFWEDFDDRSTHATNQSYRKGYSYEQNSTYCAQLVITLPAPAAVEPKHTFRLHPRPGHRMGFHPNLKLG